MKKTHKPKATVATKIKARKTDSPVVKAQDEAAEAAVAVQEKPDRQVSKQNLIIDMLKDSKGATVVELADATGWQKHSIQGAMSGALKKKLGLTIISEKEAERGRVYRIAAGRA